MAIFLATIYWQEQGEGLRVKFLPNQLWKFKLAAGHIIHCICVYTAFVYLYYCICMYVKARGLSFFQINYGSLDWLLDTTAARENQMPQDVVIEE